MELEEKIREKKRLVELMSSDEAFHNLYDLYCWFLDEKRFEKIYEDIIDEEEKIFPLIGNIPPKAINKKGQAAVALRLMSGCRKNNYGMWSVMSQLNLFWRSGRYYKESDYNRIKKLYLLPFWDYLIEEIQVKNLDVEEIQLKENDDHLRNLINKAEHKFKSNQKWEALRFIVDAFERTKTILSDDKKKSVKLILNELTDDDELREVLSKQMITYTSIANKYGIRHHEKSQKIISDEYILEFLFYNYYNFVKFILNKNSRS
jgi:hypothetical protein